MGKVIIVGDVHGCLIELEELLDKCAYRPEKDRLIFVGDLINRGPHSFQVLQLAYSLGAESVLGNHEMSLLKGSLGNGPLRKDTAKLLQKIKKQAPFLIPWIQSWPLYIREKKFIVVHAGVVPEYTLSKTPSKVLTHVRFWNPNSQQMDKYSGIPWYHLYQGKKLIVYGHWALEGLTVRKNTIGLDSACVWGGNLSALILPKQKIIQVKAKKCYVKTRQVQ